jgi:hypothetical protein
MIMDLGFGSHERRHSATPVPTGREPKDGCPAFALPKVIRRPMQSQALPRSLMYAPTTGASQGSPSRDLRPPGYHRHNGQDVRRPRPPRLSVRDRVRVVIYAYERAH